MKIILCWILVISNFIFYDIYTLNCFQERGLKKELKVVTHGSKLTSTVPHCLPLEMQCWMNEFGLSSQRTNLTRIEQHLVSTFVERWHPKTSSFHMWYGEMSITLNDVSCLLHMPVRDLFWIPQNVIEEIVVVCCWLLGNAI